MLSLARSAVIIFLRDAALLDSDMPQVSGLLISSLPSLTCFRFLEFLDVRVVCVHGCARACHHMCVAFRSHYQVSNCPWLSTLEGLDSVTRLHTLKVRMHTHVHRRRSNTVAGGTHALSFITVTACFASHETRGEHGNDIARLCIGVFLFVVCCLLFVVCCLLFVCLLLLSALVGTHCMCARSLPVMSCRHCRMVSTNRRRCASWPSLTAPWHSSSF